MSNDVVVSYFGIKIDVGSDEVEGLELRSDPRIVRARSVGLNHYWGNFGGLQEQYILFIGKELALLSADDVRELSVCLLDFRSIADNTRDKLEKAGFSQEPELLLQWQIDI